MFSSLFLLHGLAALIIGTDARTLFHANDVKYWSTADLTTLNETECDSGRIAVAQILAHNAYFKETAWENTTSSTFYGEIANGKYATNYTQKTLTCNYTGNRLGPILGFEQYLASLPRLYCDPGNMVQLQPVPKWSKPTAKCMVDNSTAIPAQTLSSKCRCSNGQAKPPKRSR